MISFIIVNYKSREDLVRCLNDLAKINDAQKCEIIIVNNDPEKISVPENIFSRTKICEINQNIGYAAANNHGLKYVKNPYICFLNPDTHSFSIDLTSIIDHIDESTIASPQILDSTNAPQEWSAGEKPTLLNTLKNKFNLHKKCWKDTELSPVYWVSGTALFTSNTLMSKMNGFCEDYFLYYEDVDLCKRLHDDSGRVLFVPHISITHVGGKSSRDARKKQKKWYYESQDRYFKKHRNFLEYVMMRLLRIFYRS